MLSLHTVDNFGRDEREYHHEFGFIDNLGNRTLFARDMLGSNRATLRNGVVTDWRDYYAYGNVRDGKSLVSGRWQYLGLEYDGETGSLHTAAREFFNLEGFFNKPDRFEFKYPSHTPYGYAKQNPFRYHDASGDSLEQNQEAFILPPIAAPTLLEKIGALLTSGAKTVGKQMLKVGTGITVLVSILTDPEPLGEGSDKPKSDENQEVFHHKTVNDDIVDKIVQSGELFGYQRKNNFAGGLFDMPPAAKAVRGKLPAGMSGVEFTTAVLPDKNGHPMEAIWSGDRPDVETRIDSFGNPYAVIKISVITYQKRKSNK